MLILLMAVAAGCFLLERLFAGWRLPPVRTWPLRVIAVNLVQIGVVLLAGVTWEKYAAAHSLLQVSRHLPPLAGGVLAYFIATFIFYWWHRARHQSDLLWRLFHQIHHSPQRLEVITSFYKHPVEMVVNSILGSLIVFSLLGLNTRAAAVYTACTALGEFLYHTNVRTPRWVGYFFQRPEMHRIHHEKDKHRDNYGDIVWWDMLFGTYQNPATWNGECGFTEECELKLPAMLAFRDVHQ